MKLARSRAENDKVEQCFWFKKKRHLFQAFYTAQNRYVFQEETATNTSSLPVCRSTTTGLQFAHVSVTQWKYTISMRDSLVGRAQNRGWAEFHHSAVSLSRSDYLNSLCLTLFLCDTRRISVGMPNHRCEALSTVPSTL